MFHLCPFFGLNPFALLSFPFTGRNSRGDDHFESRCQRNGYVVLMALPPGPREVSRPTPEVTTSTACSRRDIELDAFSTPHTAASLLAHRVYDDDAVDLLSVCDDEEELEMAFLRNALVRNLDGGSWVGWGGGFDGKDDIGADAATDAGKLEAEIGNKETASRPSGMRERRRAIVGKGEGKDDDRGQRWYATARAWSVSVDLKRCW